MENTAGMGYPVSVVQTRQQQIELESEALRKFGAEADRICSMIMNHRGSEEEITFAITNLTHRAERLFPQKMDLFAEIYLKRFERLKKEWPL